MAGRQSRPPIDRLGERSQWLRASAAMMAGQLDALACTPFQ
jgi:hypothetical protein